MSMRPLLKLEIPARPESLKTLRDALNEVLDREGADTTTRDRLVLAVHEAACNVIRHAYGDGREGTLRVTLARQRGMLRFALRDFAPPVDPSRVKPRDLDVCRPGGLGINFIDDTMDSWRLRPLKRRRGNVLTMRKRVRRRRNGEGT